MFKASIGGGAASRRKATPGAAVYRHALIRLVSPLLSPLTKGIGHGWSPLWAAMAAVLMAWDPGPTLMQRFESALSVLDAALPRRRRTPRTYQGWIKALRRCGAGALRALSMHLRVLTRDASLTGGCWTIGAADGLVPIGVDGSRFDAPRTIGNESLGFAGRDKCGPQMLMLLLVHLGSMLPWAWKAGKARDSERSLLRGLLHLLPDRTLLVADAGFTGFELLSDLHDRGIHFLVRVGKSVRLLTDLGYYRREGRHTVYLWPNAARERPPLVLRVVRVGSVYLITSVTDPRRLSGKAAAELYRRRWGMEVAFRSLKQTLQRRKVRSCAATNAAMELDWSVLGMWVLSLLGVRAIAARRCSPRSLSLARVLAALRAARSGAMTEAALRRRLGAAVQDGYQRKGRKDAWRWPHKKNPPLPGAPTIAAATSAQVRAAQQLRAELLAA